MAGAHEGNFVSLAPALESTCAFEASFFGDSEGPGSSEVGAQLVPRRGCAWSPGPGALPACVHPHRVASRRGHACAPWRPPVTHGMSVVRPPAWWELKVRERPCRLPVALGAGLSGHAACTPGPRGHLELCAAVRGTSQGRPAWALVPSGSGCRAAFPKFPGGSEAGKSVGAHLRCTESSRRTAGQRLSGHPGSRRGRTPFIPASGPLCCPAFRRTCFRVRGRAGAAGRPLPWSPLRCQARPTLMAPVGRLTCPGHTALGGGPPRAPGPGQGWPSFPEACPRLHPRVPAGRAGLPPASCPGLAKVEAGLGRGRGDKAGIVWAGP